MIVSFLAFVYGIYRLFQVNNHIKTVLSEHKLSIELPEIENLDDFLRQKQLQEKIYIIDSYNRDSIVRSRIEQTETLIDKINKVDPEFGYEMLKTITSNEPRQIIYCYKYWYHSLHEYSFDSGDKWCRMFAYDDEENIIFYAFFKVFDYVDILFPKNCQKEIKLMNDYENSCYSNNENLD